MIIVTKNFRIKCYDLNKSFISIAMTDEGDFFSELTLSDEESNRREECEACLRPVTACWCSHVPSPRVRTRTRVVVLQHPGEEKRNIRTCRMLELGLAEDCVKVVRGRKFPGKDTCLAATLTDQGTCLLYPGPDSTPLDTCDPASVNTLVILDGTWDQARKLYR